MPVLKNMRHEWFAREYVKTGVATEAYRRAYPGRRRPESNWVSASRLLRRDNVGERVRELREWAMKRSDITIEKILSDYQTALEMAKELAKPGDITNAATAQAKLVGLLIDRREVGNAGEYDNMTSIEAVIARLSEDAGPDVAAAIAKAVGIEPEAQAEEPDPDPQLIDLIDPPTGTVN